MATNQLTNRAEFLTANWRDLGMSLVTSLIAALASGLYVALSGDNLPTWVELRTVLVTAAASGAGNFLKNFLTNSQGKLLKGEGK